MFTVNKLVKPVVISMLMLPACHVMATEASLPTELMQFEDEELIALDGMQLAAAQAARPKAGSSDDLVESLLRKARYWQNQRRFDLAGNTWERVLRSNPNQEEALAGLAVYQASMGHNALANEYLSRLKRVNPKHSVIVSVDRILNPEAAASADAAEAAEAAEKAKSLVRSMIPVSPWKILDQARAMRKKGDEAAAGKKIDQMTAAKIKDRDIYYAGAIFYAEGKQWERAQTLLDKIAEKDRNELINGLRARAIVYVRTDKAKKFYTEGMDAEAVEMLSSAESDAKGNPELLARLAGHWSTIGRSDRAAELLDRNKPLTPGLQLQLANALLVSKQHGKLGLLLTEIDTSGEAMYEAGALDSIRIEHALHMANEARLNGRFADGLASLKPTVGRYPQHVGLLLAQAKLQGGAGESNEVLKSVDAVLVLDPGNHDAIHLGAVHAIRLNNYSLADQYLAGSKIDDAGRPGLYSAAGVAAKENKNTEKAAGYFAVAKRLSEGKGVIDIAISPERQLSGSESRQESYVEGGYSIRYKTGMLGLGYLYETEVPVSWHIPLEEGRSSVIVKLAQVELDSGNIAVPWKWLDLFGTNGIPPLVPPPPPLNKASGTALSIGYQSTPLSADIGISPSGFAVNNIVGGIRWNTEFAGSYISLEASRRSMTDSLLSYAGMRDNNIYAGQVWGGVVKTGGLVGVYYPFGGEWAGYTSAGLYSYSGTNVANNSSYNANATLIYQIARTEEYVSSIAARVATVSYNNNQQWFFWGHGGYYSPQTDNSISMPFTVYGKTEKLAYDFGFTPNLSDITEGAAQFYPTDPLLGVGFKPGKVRSGNFSWKMDWTLEYEFAPQFVIGNRSHYEQSQTYQHVGSMVYLRYDIEKNRRSRIPPNPLRPYYATTEGGAGLN